MTNMPLVEDLRLFCAVVRNGSFVATAAELGVSPAFVTKRIALLENVLRVCLLHRTTRRVKVTDDGEIVYRWAQRITDDVEQMAESVRTSKTIPRGLLRICTSTGYGRKRVAPALSELAVLYPLLSIKLEIVTLPVDVIADGFDLDIRIGGNSEPNLIVKRIAANARVLCAAPVYLERKGIPTSISDLEQHNCIVIRERDQSFGVWKLKGPNGIETVRVTGSLSSNNGEIVHKWALDGHGIILRSTWDVDQALEQGRLIRILPDYQQDADVYAVYPLKLSESAKVRVCVEFLQERLGGK